MSPLTIGIFATIVSAFIIFLFFWFRSDTQYNHWLPSPKENTTTRHLPPLALSYLVAVPDEIMDQANLLDCLIPIPSNGRFHLHENTLLVVTDRDDKTYVGLTNQDLLEALAYSKFTLENHVIISCRDQNPPWLSTEEALQTPQGITWSNLKERSLKARAEKYTTLKDLWAAYAEKF